MVVICLSALSLMDGGVKFTPAAKIAHAAASGKPIKIGSVGAMSGSSASNGAAQKQGVDLAVKEINAAGGILGRAVEVIYRDDEGDPTKSKTAAEELIYKEQVDFIVGPTNSTCAAAAHPSLTENKIPNILAIATGDTLIDPKKFPYAFRIQLPNGMQAEALVRIVSKQNYKNIALVGDTSALGVDGIAAMKRWCAELGVNPVATITYKADDADMTPVANSLKNAKADCALFWTLGADAAKIVRALERIDYIDNLDIYGYTGIAMTNFPDLAGPGAAKCASLSYLTWSVEPGANRLTGQRYQNLYEKINAAYGPYGVGSGTRSTATANVAGSYDAVMMFKWAAEKAGSTDPDAIKKVFETNIAEYEPFFAGGYSYGPDDHEGFSAEEIVPILIGEKLNKDLPIVYQKK
jgi:branched-chain amino acid transport system substrate-binding protein